MKFTESVEIAHVDPEEAPLYTQKALENISAILTNGITFADNFSSKFLTITFSNANTDSATIHGLGRVPTGYLVIGASAATSVYDGSSANTSSLLYLRASVAATVRVLVF